MRGGVVRSVVERRRRGHGGLGVRWGGVVRRMVWRVVGVLVVLVGVLIGVLVG